MPTIEATPDMSMRCTKRAYTAFSNGLYGLLVVCTVKEYAERLDAKRPHKAKWISEYRCSRCNEAVTGQPIICPNCWADMEEN